jgi:hypothetical protein
LDALIASLVVIEVNESLGLRAKVIFRRELGGEAVLRGTWDSIHTVKKDPDPSLVEDVEACCKSIFEALRFGWLGLVEEERAE